jgi:DNA-binding transcriptional MerR regulator
VTRRAGVTARTVRYYEGLKLIPAGKRKGQGQRHYDEQTVERLLKIEQLKGLGLSLEDVGEVIELYFSDASRLGAKKKVLGLLQNHLAEVDSKLAHLKALRRDLVGHVERFELWIESRRRG